MGKLTPDELAILNGFMYAEKDHDEAGALHDDAYDGMWDEIRSAPEGMTLGDVVKKYLYGKGVVEGLSDSDSYTMLTSAGEWKAIFDSIMKSENLRSLRLGGMDSYNKHGSKAACFIDTEGQPYIIFKGTGAIGEDTEWPDNFTGGATVGTKQQDAALNYLEEIYVRFGRDVIVSGHSKGGNKAQFVTIVSDHVKECYSFDGQGFSAEFIQIYADRIAKRRGLIKEYNHYLEPVSALLIPIADPRNIHYIAGDYSGISSYPRTHAPIALLTFDGSVLRLYPETERSGFSRALNDFIVYLVNVASPGDFEKIMGLFAHIFARGPSPENWDLSVIGDPEWAEEIGLLTAYLEHYDRYDDLLASLGDLVTPEEKAAVGAALGALELAPGLKLALLLLLIAGGGVGIARMGAWLRSNRDWIDQIEAVRKARSGQIAHRMSSGSRTGVIATSQVRDFSQAKLDEMISIIREIKSEPFFDPTRWDVWYRAEAFFGRLQPQRYQDNMREYYRKVMDINDMSIVEMTGIFQEVRSIDSAYASEAKGLAFSVKRLASQVRLLAQ